jgi:NADH:ubiquinone oxidoreductase subunit E
VLRLVALIVSAVAALVVAACTTLLVVEEVRARARAAEDESRLAVLQEEAQLDDAAAARLNEENRRLADDTLARREHRSSIVGWLIGAALVLIVFAKWAQALRGWRAPPPDVLAVLRAPDVTLPPAETLRGVDWPALDQAEVDAIVARHGTSPEAAIPILSALLERYGYLPDEALRRVCELTEITPAQIAGNATFYANFRASPVGRHVLRVCHGTACHVAGSRQVAEELRRHLGIADEADTDERRDFTLERVACLGCCSLAPVLTSGEWTGGHVTPEGALRVVDSMKAAAP